jgi:hypothetical protein
VHELSVFPFAGWLSFFLFSFLEEVVTNASNGEAWDDPLLSIV